MGVNGQNMIGESATPPWICGYSIIDSRDAQSYTTVQIGTQCWMVENMNIGVMVNGINDQTDNDIIEKYCYQDDIYNSNVMLWRTYQWDEMMQYITTAGTQGIALQAGTYLLMSNGWHWKRRLKPPQVLIGIQLDGEVLMQVNP